MGRSARTGKVGRQQRLPTNLSLPDPALEANQFLVFGLSATAHHSQPRPTWLVAGKRKIFHEIFKNLPMQGELRSQRTVASSSLMPFQRIWTPMQRRMKDDNRSTTFIPVSPSRWASDSLKR